LSEKDYEEEKRNKKGYDIKVINWLFKLALPYRRFMVLSLIFMLITAVLELLVPYITKIAVDKYIFLSWREARFSDKDEKFENLIKEKYSSSGSGVSPSPIQSGRSGIKREGNQGTVIIPLGKGSYLVDLSRIEKEDKVNLEKLGYVSKDRYLVVDKTKVESGRLNSVLQIIKNHPDVFKPIGQVYFANYSSLKKLSNSELRVLRVGDIRQVNKLALLLLFILFCDFLFSSIYTYFLNYSGQKIMHRIRSGVFSHLVALPQSFFDKNPVGKLTTRVTNDVNAINEMYTSVLVQFFKDLLVIFGVLIVMFNMNKTLTLFIFVLTIILGIAGVLFKKRLQLIYRSVRRSIAKLNAFVQESVRGIVIVKLYLRETENFERFKDVNRENYRANMDQLFAFATFRPIIEFISTFAVALILWYGGLRVIKLDLTLGALIAYLAYIRMLFGPIVELTERYNIFQSAIAASENLYDLVNLETEEREKGRRLEKVRGKLEFRDVWFSYNGDNWVLKNVSFSAEPGETVALVGLTGSGKTTIINLILKFYEIQKGQILLDGVDIRELDPDFLRANISTVFQDMFLFGKSISDVREPFASDQVEDQDRPQSNDGASHNGNEFAKVIGTNELINFDGRSISSGEKQLVSLGKAFSKDVKVLILDEATSLIDAQMELKVQEALKNSSRKRTTIIVAHRLSNVRGADKIIVIHKGEVFEVGTHSELLTKRGIYYNLYRLQNEIYRFSS
jgi:ATP-binding cassette, subfamily B, multidrug efflux pump